MKVVLKKQMAVGDENMEETITFSGVIAEEVKETCREMMKRLRSQSPSDSVLRCHISDREPGYSGMVRIQALTGEFTAHAIHIDPYDLLEKLAFEILDQIRDWRQNRFKNGEEPRKKRILIIDDDPGSIESLKKGFDHFGCEVDVVTNGHFGIEKILCKPVDLIVVDAQMPGLSGCQTIERLQEKVSKKPQLMNHWPNSEIPFVTYSGGDVDSKDFEKSNHLILLGHWKKRTQYQQLKEQIRQALNYLSATMIDC